MTGAAVETFGPKGFRQRVAARLGLVLFPIGRHACPSCGGTGEWDPCMGIGTHCLACRGGGFVYDYPPNPPAWPILLLIGLGFFGAMFGLVAAIAWTLGRV